MADLRALCQWSITGRAVGDRVEFYCAACQQCALSGSAMARPTFCARPVTAGEGEGENGGGILALLADDGAMQ